MYDPEVVTKKAELHLEQPLEDLPDEWVCPICLEGKEVFVKT